MAVELLMDHHRSFGASNTQANAVREAASVGIRTVEEVLKLLNQNQDQQQQEEDIKVVTDLAVNSFKRVISLLDRTKPTGHARFRRAPVSPVSSPPPQQQQQQLREKESSQEIKQEREKKEFQEPIPSSSIQLIINNNKNYESNNSSPKKEQKLTSAFKIYPPTPTHRLPPLPTTTTTNHHDHRNQKANIATINFSNSSPAISGATSFISSLTTGETDSVQRSMSTSGFQFTQPPHANKPPLYSSSHKRKCTSMDDAALKCSAAGGSTSGRCHCAKKR